MLKIIYEYVALDMYSGNYGTLTTSTYHKVGDEVKGQWQIKEFVKRHFVKA